VVKDKAPELQHKVTEAAKDASSAVMAKVSGGHGSDSRPAGPGASAPGASAPDEPGTTVPSI